MRVEVKVETVIELATCPQDGTIYVVLFDTPSGSVRRTAVGTIEHKGAPAQRSFEALGLPRGSTFIPLRMLHQRCCTPRARTRGTTS